MPDFKNRHGLRAEVHGRNQAVVALDAASVPVAPPLPFVDNFWISSPLGL